MSIVFGFGGGEMAELKPKQKKRKKLHGETLGFTHLVVDIDHNDIVIVNYHRGKYFRFTDEEWEALKEVIKKNQV